MRHGCGLYRQGLRFRVFFDVRGSLVGGVFRRILKFWVPPFSLIGPRFSVSEGLGLALGPSDFSVSYFLKLTCFLS